MLRHKLGVPREVGQVGVSPGQVEEGDERWHQQEVHPWHEQVGPPDTHDIEVDGSKLHGVRSLVTVIEEKVVGVLEPLEHLHVLWASVRIYHSRSSGISTQEPDSIEHDSILKKG